MLPFFILILTLENSMRGAINTVPRARRGWNRVRGVYSFPPRGSSDLDVVDHREGGEGEKECGSQPLRTQKCVHELDVLPRNGKDTLIQRAQLSEQSLGHVWRIGCGQERDVTRV